MVRKGLVVALFIGWLMVLLSGCVEKDFSLITSTPSATALADALPTRSAASPTPQPTSSPTPQPAASPTPQPVASPTPQPTPGAEEGKPTPPGGEQPFVPPPTVALPSPDTAWQEYELADTGIRIRIPAEWEKLRMPGGYIFAADGQYLVNVGTCCEEMPRQLSEFQKAIPSRLRDHHEQDFTLEPIKGTQWDGIRVWHKSNPNVCSTVYIPTPELVRQITFLEPGLCESDGEHLVPLAEMILNSVEVFPPRTQ